MDLAKFEERLKADPSNTYLLSQYKVAKEALLAETHKKCAYCEAFFLHVYFGDVEHILAKGFDPVSRTLDYMNLTIACACCNNNKSDYEAPQDDDDERLIDPTRDDPSVHLHALGPRLFHRTRRGEVTIEVIELNRDDLERRRAEALKALEAERSRYVAERNPSIKSRLKRELQRKANPDQEFSFVKSIAMEVLLHAEG
ncbi:MAG TPA: HNH endonuclease [Candidatus Baltobacteraceae bacterium]|nr:HNH endonuclease [Candidatus Baltobacteraceae bacterium]